MPLKGQRLTPAQKRSRAAARARNMRRNSAKRTTKPANRKAAKRTTKPKRRRRTAGM